MDSEASQGHRAGLGVPVATLLAPQLPQGLRNPWASPFSSGRDPRTLASRIEPRNALWFLFPFPHVDLHGAIAQGQRGHLNAFGSPGPLSGVILSLWTPAPRNRVLLPFWGSGELWDLSTPTGPAGAPTTAPTTLTLLPQPLDGTQRRAAAQPGPAGHQGWGRGSLPSSRLMGRALEPAGGGAEGAHPRVPMG